jgi:thiol-disulfide isomerase/thioredoxin
MIRVVIIYCITILLSTTVYASVDSVISRAYRKNISLDCFLIKYKISYKPILKSYTYKLERELSMYRDKGLDSYSFKLTGDTDNTVIHTEGHTYYIDHKSKTIDSMSQGWQDALTNNMSQLYLPMLNEYYMNLLSDSAMFANRDLVATDSLSEQGKINIIWRKKNNNDILLDSSINIITLDTVTFLPVRIVRMNYGSYDTAIEVMELLDFAEPNREVTISFLEDVRILVNHNGYRFAKMSYDSIDGKTLNLKVGAVFPNIVLTSETGDTAMLYDLPSHVTVLDFWYMSCIPCIAAIPNINDVERRFPDDTVRVVSINPFDKKNRSKLPGFKKRYSVSYPIYFCDQSTVEFLGINGFPRIIILDKDKRVIYLSAVPYFLPNIVNGLVKKL